MSDNYAPEMEDPGDGDMFGAFAEVVERAASRNPSWPWNRNHEAARRHVNDILRNHGRPDYSRRETQIAELLDELIRERDESRVAASRTHREAPQ